MSIEEGEEKKNAQVQVHASVILFKLKCSQGLVKMGVGQSISAFFICDFHLRENSIKNLIFGRKFFEN